LAVAEFEIHGLRQFSRALKNLGGEIPRSLRDYNVKAAEAVVEVGKEYARSPQQAKAAESLRASRSASYVAILLGDNNRYAFARGAEWGARRYKQFPPWRGNQWMSWGGGPGYFLHPAIRTVGSTVLEEYWQSIRALRAEAFPE
jgi:hypothetical protein